MTNGKSDKNGDSAKIEGIENKIKRVPDNEKHQIQFWLLQVQINSVWATQKAYSIEQNGVNALVNELYKHNQTMEWRLKEIATLDSVAV